ncbi:hypothetical protein [Streptomyces sp. NPDC088775]|uniref:hypothetical protein n=1 Tax=Streptomyces sp. NPDC088775 TaxID=3365896 RepID=UPI00381311B6
MTVATLPSGKAPDRPRSRDSAPRLRTAGPGWEVLLIPAPLAECVAHACERSAMAASALGWVFAHAGQWGIFLPERSDVPAWPSGTTYLKTGASVTLPPFHSRLTERDRTQGWVNLDGPPLSKPLILHPVVTRIAADMSTCASPVPES